MRETRGVTFVEILTSLIILGILTAGLLNLLLLCFQWNDDSRETLIAMSEVQNKIEETRGIHYDEIFAAYSQNGNPGDQFDLAGINGTGTVLVSNINADRLSVRVAACWRQGRSGRVVGEDRNLNGALDAGEDSNGNNLIDSPAVLTTFISRR